jgi:hypothetical protein
MKIEELGLPEGIEIIPTGISSSVFRRSSKGIFNE